MNAENKINKLMNIGMRMNTGVYECRKENGLINECRKENK